MKNLFIPKINSKGKSAWAFLVLIASMTLSITIHAQSIQGPYSPNTVTYQAVACLGCPGSTWSNVNNVKVSDGQYAAVSLDTFQHCFQTTCYFARGLLSTNFGFSIPSNATITGVRADVQRLAVAPNIIRDSAVYLIENNAALGMNKADSVTWPIVDTYTSYGDSIDLWGAALTPANVNDPTFGLLFKPYNSGTTGFITAADVDHVQMSVYYTIPTTISSGDNNNSIVTIYPNPLKGFLQIKGINKMKSFVMIEIRNMVGQIVFHIPAGFLSTATEDSVFLNISWLASGMYLVQLTSNDDTPITRKIVKE